MDKGHIAQRAPFKVEVEEGKTYWWCRCGHSESQPYCDGSHKVKSELKPMKFVAEESKTMFLCGCKHTGNEPSCDGSHRKI
jgi:CDGSH-type Zn-finger protein